MATPSPLQWVLLVVTISYGASKAGPNLTSIGCVGRNCYYVVTSPRTWDDARDICRSHAETYLAEIPDSRTRLFIHEAMMSHKLANSGMWFGGHEVMYDAWTWLNDVTFYGDIHEFDNGLNKPFCGAINKKRFEGSVCAESKRFLCTRSDMILGGISDGSFYISPENERLTWYQAREDCISRGMDLATIVTNSTLLLNLLINPHDNNFWVGLVKSRYTWERDGRDIKYLYFKLGEPNYKKELCLEMTSEGEYNDEMCHMMRPFLCQSVNKTKQPLLVEESQLKKSAVIIGVSVGAGALLLILGLTVCIILICKRPKKDHDHQHPRIRLPVGEEIYAYNNTITTSKSDQDYACYDVTNQFSYVTNDAVTSIRGKRGILDSGFSSLDHLNSVDTTAGHSGRDDDGHCLYENTLGGLPHYYNSKS